MVLNNVSVRILVSVRSNSSKSLPQAGHPSLEYQFSSEPGKYAEYARLRRLVNRPCAYR